MFWVRAICGKQALWGEGRCHLRQFMRTDVELTCCVSTGIQGAYLRLHIKKNDHIWADSEPRWDRSNVFLGGVGERGEWEHLEEAVLVPPFLFMAHVAHGLFHALHWLKLFYTPFHLQFPAFRKTAGILRTPVSPHERGPSKFPQFSKYCPPWPKGLVEGHSSHPAVILSGHSLELLISSCFSRGDIFRVAGQLIGRIPILLF